MAIRFKPNSFPVRWLITSYYRRPEYLPTYDEEVEWLVKDLLTILENAVDALNKNPKSSTERTRRNRFAWALAVLMRDPPVLSTAAIRARLTDPMTNPKILAIVERYYKKLP